MIPPRRDQIEKPGGTGDADGLHQTNPGDGGNGVHADNNAGLAAVLDPVNGQPTTNAGGTAPDVSAELLDGTRAGG